MAWRVARSLDKLLAQINAAYPRRSKRSDGSIGDAAHASRSSDHNPWYGPGIVTARDFTHDPANGFDAHAFAERLRRLRDPRIKYVISNGRIFSATVSPWVWRRYTGANPHDKHVHVSVVASPRCDDTSPWAGVTADSTAGSRFPNVTPTKPGGFLMAASEKDQEEAVRRILQYLDTKVSHVDDHVANTLKVKNPVTGQVTDLTTALWSVWHYAYAAYMAVANPAKLAAELAPRLQGKSDQAAIEAALRSVLGSLNDPKEK